METLPDLENLPDDLDELGVLFQAVNASREQLAESHPKVWTERTVGEDGKTILALATEEQNAELNEVREVAREIAAKMSRLRLEAKAT